MSLLKFSDLINSNAVYQIRDNLFQNLPQNIKFADTYDTIVHYAIKQIDIAQHLNLKDQNAVAECCVKILSQLGYYLHGNLIEQLWDGHTSWYNPVYHYFKHVLGFNDLPKNILAKLDRSIKEDLRELLSLIQRYESTEKAIKTYLIEGEARGEHEDKIRLDFYFRCINERNKIVQYLTFDLENRAFDRSINNHVLGGETGHWYNEFMDKPYRWWVDKPNPYFDYKLIDINRHRLNHVPLSNLNELEELQRSGKKEDFYTELAKIISPAAVFHGINNYYIPINNLLSDRKLIFEELQKLFEQELWYGFTALALPQVEGIFSDMTRLLSPDRKFSSLPNKVSAVRPFYDYHERTFDYFEYILPRLRNKFLHSGNAVGDDFKILAFDLLYDLYYILDVFNSLKDDQIVLSNLMNDHLELHLISIEDFNKFFRLLDSLKKRAKDRPSIALTELLQRWEDFESSVLSESGIYLMRWSEIKFELKEKTVKLLNDLSSLTSGLSEPMNLYGMKASELRKRVDELEKAIATDVVFYKDRYEKILAYYTFLEQFSKHLKSFKPSDAAELKAIFKEEKDRDRHTKMIILKKIFENITE